MSPQCESVSLASGSADNTLGSDDLSVERKHGDPVFRVVLRRVPAALIARGIGAVTGFGLNLFMARRLGAHGAGVLQLAITISMASAVVATLGLDMAGLRFASGAARMGDMPTFRAVYRHAIRAGLAASLCGSAIIFALSESLAVHVFQEPGMTKPLQIMALTVVPRAMSHILAAFLRALGRITMAGFLDFVGISTIAVAVLAFTRLDSVVSFAALLCGVTFAVWLTGLFAMKQRLRDTEPGRFELGELLRTAMPLMWAAVLSFTFQVADTLMLGLLRSGEEVGVYAAVLKLGAVVSMLLLAVNYVTAPQFAGMWHAGDIVALGKLARRTALLMSLLVTPVVAALVIFPGPILSMFGAEFRVGGTALIAVALGQFANVATGSVGYLLAMTGNQRAFRNTLAAGAILFIGLNLVLIPRYGMTGAGIAFGVAITVQNLLQTAVVRRRIGILVLPIPGARFAAIKGALD